MKPERMSHNCGGFNRNRRRFDDSHRRTGHREYRRYSEEDFESRGGRGHGFDREYSRRNDDREFSHKYERPRHSEDFEAPRRARTHRVYRSEPYGKLTEEQIRQSNEERRKLRAERDEVEATPNYHYDIVKKQMEEAQNQDDWSPGMGFHSPDKTEDVEKLDELANEYSDLAPSEVEEKVLARLESMGASADNKTEDENSEIRKSVETQKPIVPVPFSASDSIKEAVSPESEDTTEEDFVETEGEVDFKADEEDFPDEDFGNEQKYESQREHKSFFEDFDEDDDDDLDNRYQRKRYQGKGDRKSGYGKKSYSDVRFSRSERRDDRSRRRGDGDFSRPSFRDRNRDRFGDRDERRPRRDSERPDGVFRKYKSDRGFHKEHRKDSFEDRPRRAPRRDDDYSFERQEHREFQKPRSYGDDYHREEHPSKEKFFERFEKGNHSRRVFGRSGKRKPFRSGNF